MKDFRKLKVWEKAHAFALQLCQDRGLLISEKHTRLNDFLLDCNRMLNSFLQTLQESERQLQKSKAPVPQKS